ncbi:MAG: [Fe-Fe] hydrogenase large subunit C-terminal domain-containing protein [Clostridiales bacterium]
MENYYHSVTLDSNSCKGCTHCIKKCPTEAIRIKKSKAKIIKERCIDCGECIRVCPHHAKRAVTDPLSMIDDYEYKVVLPSPCLYGQFNNLDDVNIVLMALLNMGFDKIFEVAKAAEIVSDITRSYVNKSQVDKPVISSACPTIVRLISVRFPELLDKLLPFHAPIELAAKMARKEALEETGLPSEKIGIFFITPCPAKNTAVKSPLGMDHSEVDGVIAIKEIYPPLLAQMKKIIDTDEIASAGRIGINWGSSGGEATAVMNDRYLAADGIENVIKVLEDMEDEKFTDLDFVELNACPGGCVGGVLTVENPYIAKAKLKRLSKLRPVACNRINKNCDFPVESIKEEPIAYKPVMQLDSDRTIAMHMMKDIQEIESRLYGIDCGSCGAPTCRAYAEDVVRGFATEDGCIYRLREEVQQLSQEMMTLAGKLPQAMSLESSNNDYDNDNDKEKNKKVKTLNRNNPIRRSNIKKTSKE